MEIFPFPGYSPAARKILPLKGKAMTPCSDARYWTRLLFIAGLLLTAAGLSGVAAQPAPRLVRVFVALADNEHQGIVPVPPAIGNGDDPEHNLYWGASYGVRAFFRRTPGWKETAHTVSLSPVIMERSIFIHSASGTVMVADAYRGREINQAAADFFRAAAGMDVEIAGLPENARRAGPLKAALAVYVGHNVLMERLAADAIEAKGPFQSAGPEKRDAIMLACASRNYFGQLLQPTGARPLLWTADLMAPEAYTLKAALDGWMADEPAEQIRLRAAAAYAKYQKISVKAARGLLVSGYQVR
jgi:hypothetical protein